MILTYKYRIKDSVSRKALCAHARNVNFIWNFCNQQDRDIIDGYNAGKIAKLKSLSNFDMNLLLKGKSKETGLNSLTIQSISDNFAIAKSSSIKKSKSRKTSGQKSFIPIINWRSYKRHLGWIPLKAKAFQWNETDSTITYQKKVYKFWKSRPLPADAIIKTGSFNEDSKGRWYINITFESSKVMSNHPKPNRALVGIDLGIKDLVTVSDGTKFHPANMTKKYQDKLSLAQQAKKKKLVTAINAKIKNSRKDYLHKLSTEILTKYGDIAVGDISSQELINKSVSSNLNKGIYDASWYFLKTLLEYKAIKLGSKVEIINESYSTQTCNVCGSIEGPKGTSGLNVREWKCTSCHAKHDRDINAAKNIKNVVWDKRYPTLILEIRKQQAAFRLGY